MVPVISKFVVKHVLFGLLIRSIFRGKHFPSPSVRVQFFQRKIKRINGPTKTCVALITNLLSIRATISRKMLINNTFETQTVTGNPTGNSRCHALASHALSMSCSFGQLSRSIKSRCVVTNPPPPPPPPHSCGHFGRQQFHMTFRETVYQRVDLQVIWDVMTLMRRPRRVKSSCLDAMKTSPCWFLYECFKSIHLGVSQPDGSDLEITTKRLHQQTTVKKITVMEINQVAVLTDSIESDKISFYCA